MDLTNAFKGHLQTVTATAKAAGSYVLGEWTEGATTPTSVEAVVIPLTPNAIRYLPEGAYDMKDIGVYVASSPALQFGDTITIGAKVYTIRDVGDRPHGTYTKYLCKFIVPEVAR